MGVHYHPSYMRFLCAGSAGRDGRGELSVIGREVLSDAGLLRKWYGLDCLAILGSENACRARPPLL